MTALAKPSIWDLWLRADRKEPLDPSSRSILFRDLLRANGYVVPGGAAHPVPLAGLAEEALAGGALTGVES